MTLRPCRIATTSTFALLLAASPLFAQPASNRPPAEHAKPSAPGHSADTALFDIANTIWLDSDRDFHAGRYEDCIRKARIIVTLDPGFVDVYGTAAWLLESLGRRDEAVQFLRQGVAANPHRYEVYFDFGWYYQRQHDLPHAIEQFEQAVKYDAPVMVHKSLAHAYRENGQLDKSLAVWQRLHQEHPTDAVIKNNLDRVLRMLGK